MESRLVNDKNKTTHEEIWYIRSHEEMKKVHQILRSKTRGYAWERDYSNRRELTAYNLKNC